MSKNNEVKTTDTEFDLSVRSKAKTKAKQTKAKKAETVQVEAEQTTIGQVATEQTAVEQTKDNQAKVEAASEPRKPKSLKVKPEQLVPFDNHPYKVIDDDSMDELVESIRVNGILNPLIVRPIEGVENSYEIISGHRRYHAAQRLGLKKIPCTVYDVDRDTATVMMVDSNCQRTELLPSEKAWAYKMKMDAMSRQGKRTDLSTDGTCAPVEHKSKSRDIIAADAGESREQVRRYIRLTNLVPELLQFVDDSKIGMRPAVELSYLSEEVQRDIVDIIDEHNCEVFPSHAQARRIRDQFKNSGITYEQIAAIMDEQKPNQVSSFKISEDKVAQITGKRFTPKDFDDFIEKALKCYVHQLKKERDQER